MFHPFGKLGVLKYKLLSHMAKNIEMQGAADFDWEALQLDGYTKIERSELSDVYEKTLTSINEKEVIQGTVALLNKKEVIVNIGYKSEGVIAANEFRYNPDLKIGDVVDVYVECREDKTGQLVVSHRTARMHSAWIRVNDVLRTGEIITGFVKCRTKGGLIVDVFGIEAFLPGSQIDVKPIRDYDIYVGKNMEFKVVKINEEFRNVVVSHKALIEAELEEQKKTNHLWIRKRTSIRRYCEEHYFLWCVHRFRWCRWIDSHYRPFLGTRFASRRDVRIGSKNQCCYS